MLYAKVLFHNTSFDSKFSLARNTSLIMGIPLGIGKQGLIFTFITYTKSKQKKKLNLATEQHNFL
jgi:hypothetical protein